MSAECAALVSKLGHVRAGDKVGREADECARCTVGDAKYCAGVVGDDELHADVEIEHGQHRRSELGVVLQVDELANVVGPLGAAPAFLDDVGLEAHDRVGRQ